MAQSDKAGGGGAASAPSPPPAPAPSPKRPSRREEAGPARVRPLYVWVLYYCYIVVYLAAAWLRATEGDLAASDLVDGLVNDHLAVASGSVPRLATYGFVCEGPLTLFMQLATLATVGAEAEALLGYSAFWAVFWLGLLGGGLADAALSELPVTAGPANGAAGLVGALASYYVANWGLEERLAAARKAARRRRSRALSSREGEAEDGAGPLSLSAGRDSLEEAEAEVEVLPLLSVRLEAALSERARGLLSVLTALVVAGQGLLEFGGASGAASWIGLSAAFWTGAILTYGAGPRYEPAAAAGAGAAQDAGAERGDADGLLVVDVCPPARRRAVLGGSTAALGAMVVGWLAWMGADI
ncbi:hypothetical protein GPECTOR_172g200 [Gonium pectorale]|uniref:Peptidase S54 rhomboid domain-containing protein n=1 Tax=Gonium pectorale TaxID=33097 RepID=A0A150FXC4_GONPE|nr:hypothetical protein GPECTOR_172g200 [Gonium pectorale]|eukprot:KXZ42263.1 hypothetical protein GPECTOR_172g200 [Gonium pectorale]